MCDLCGKRICAASCPSYDEQTAGSGQVRGKCAVCGKALYQDSKTVRKCGSLLCSECADGQKQKTARTSYLHVRF
jgi:hypothetical protein